jgi:NNP family nitrate/nitrite transporter-like MFS transporter
MANFRDFLKSGHPPTLWSAFLYFDFCFAIWVLNGAMAPFISESFGLSPAEKGFMISVPILSGALMRFPLGILAQYIGRKNASLVEMSMILIAMIYGYFFVNTYAEVLIMGVLLGIAGASFGVALSLGSGWFPAKYKGLAMGIAGAGNSGTVLAVLFAPPLATAYGWQAVYGFGALVMLVPILVMIIFAKEPPDREHQTFREHISCLWEKDGWVFNLVYIVTFGGFIGLSNFLPTYFHDQFGVSKIEAGQLTMLAALMGSGIRVVGGYISDRWGGINTLTLMFTIIIATMTLGVVHQFEVIPTTILFMFCFAALGAGNGSLFQLVPLRWPLTTAVAGSMIGEIGALGGSIIPNAMGLSKQYTGSFAGGFLVFASIAVVALFVLRVAQRRWVRTWVEAGGRARVGAPPPLEDRRLVMGPAAPHAAAVGGIQYRIILFPVGGDSELGEQAIRQAAFLSKTTGATLALVHVDEHSSQISGMGADSAEFQSVREQWLQEGRDLLDREAGQLMKFGVQSIEKVLLEGRMAEEIAGLAAERNADLIVLASRRRSPMGQLLMGGHTYELFTKSPCPILRIVR